MKGMCYFTNVVLFCIARGASGLLIHNSTDSTSISNFTDMNSTLNAQVSALIPKSRRKRWISQSDMLAILDYHNKVRANVFPPAANMEYMVSASFNWDSIENVLHAKLVGYFLFEICWRNVAFVIWSDNLLYNFFAN